jgi:hypothetical protein
MGWVWTVLVGGALASGAGGADLALYRVNGASQTLDLVSYIDDLEILGNYYWLPWQQPLAGKEAAILARRSWKPTSECWVSGCGDMSRDATEKAWDSYVHRHRSDWINDPDVWGITVTCLPDNGLCSLGVMTGRNKGSAANSLLGRVRAAMSSADPQATLCKYAMPTRVAGNQVASQKWMVSMQASAPRFEVCTWKAAADASTPPPETLLYLRPPRHGRGVLAFRQRQGVLREDLARWAPVLPRLGRELFLRIEMKSVY